MTEAMALESCFACPVCKTDAHLHMDGDYGVVFVACSGCTDSDVTKQANMGRDLPDAVFQWNRFVAEVER